MPKRQYELTEESIKIKFAKTYQQRARVVDLNSMIDANKIRLEKFKIKMLSHEKERRILKQIMDE